MSTTAPGRNDPCPCGSGRKYKKCHLAEHEAAARAAAVPREVKPEIFSDPRLSRLAAPIGKALRAITERRLGELPLAELRALLAKGAPLGHLRFDATHFRETVAKHTREAPPSGDEPWRTLWERAARELAPAPERTRERWLDLVLTRLEGAPPAPEASALAAAAAMLLVGRLAPDVPVESQPFFDEVFLAQLADAAETVSAEPNPASLAELAENHPALPAQLSVVAPALARETPPDEAGAVERAKAALASERPPPVLALDELLWLEASFADVLATTGEAADPEARRRQRSERTVQVLREAAGAFGDAARERLARIAADARLSGDAREAAQDLVVALGAAPAKVLLALVHAPRRVVQWRSGLERRAFEHLEGTASADGLEEYAAWLEGADELDAAVRVREVRALTARRPAADAGA